MNTVAYENLLPAAGESGRFGVCGVDVRADRILRIQGYSDPARVRARIRAAARDVADLAGDLATGEVGYRQLGVSRLEGGVLELDGRHRFECEGFDHYLTGCSQALLFVLSAGAAFEAHTEAFMREDRPVHALFLDTAGWLAVESVTHQFTERLRRACAARALRLTRRLGPGYSYHVGGRTSHWDLAQQRVLFAALGDAPLPARLMDSATMHPKMSRSGLFGLRAIAPSA